jgi:hypothetical protein
MTRSLARRRRGIAARLRMPALALLLLGLLAVPASAATVTSGKLAWSSTKIYDLGQPDRTIDHTWLGYATSAFPLANGTATPSDGATGDTITNATASGTVATWSYPASGGSYDPADGSGTIAFGGAVTFLSPAPGGPPNGGHGFTVSLTKPRVVLNGDSGQLFASGVTAGARAGDAPVAYPDAQPVFDLDLSSATVTLHADGSRTIAGIVPRIASANLVFPGYAAGAGPERTPNTFGSFSLRVKVSSPAGPAGPKGDKGDRGETGQTIRLQTSLLRKAPYADGGKRHAIALLTTKGKRVVATGALRARTIHVQLAAGQAKRLHGVYLLRVGDRPAVRVRVL